MGLNSFKNDAAAKDYGDEYSVKILENVKSSTINKQRAQIWIEFESKYYSESLGCKPNLIPSIFPTCDSPRFEAMQ